MEARRGPRTYAQVQGSVDADLVDPERASEGPPPSGAPAVQGPAGILEGRTWLVGTEISSSEVGGSVDTQQRVAVIIAGDASAIAPGGQVVLPAEKKAPPDVKRVGVLFVHGVGSQPQSETVREFGQPLIDWVEEWHRNRHVHGFKLLWSRLSYGAADSSGPASYALRIPEYERELFPHEPKPSNGQDEITYPPQTWILAEAWWASSLATPSLSFVLGWALGSYPDVMGTLIRNGWDQLLGRAASGGYPALSGLGRAISALNTVAVLMGYVIALVPGALAILILALVSKIPVPGFEQFVLTRLLQPLLVNNLGDHVVFLRDEVQAAHIRRTVYDAVRWLVNDMECERVLIAAHSQGTVVAFDALSNESIGRLKDSAQIREDLAKVSTLVTFGAALNRAWRWMDAQTRGREEEPQLRTLAKDIPKATNGTKRTKWIDLWSEFDWAPVGRLANGSADRVPVTNNLSAVSDHGAYFRNYEEFVSRLAQEIDSPEERQNSRFWSEPPGSNEQNTQKVGHRQKRVVLWAALRLMAWAAFFGTMALRYGEGGLEVRTDGAAVWAFIVELPALGGFPTLLGAVGEVLMRLVSGLPLVPVWLEGFRLSWVPVILAGLAVGLPFVIVYLLALVRIFTDWHERHGLATAHERPTRWSFTDAALRAGVFAALMLAVEILVWTAPPIGEITSLLATGTDAP